MDSPKKRFSTKTFTRTYTGNPKQALNYTVSWRVRNGERVYSSMILDNFRQGNPNSHGYQKPTFESYFFVVALVSHIQRLLVHAFKDLRCDPTHPPKSLSGGPVPLLVVSKSHKGSRAVTSWLHDTRAWCEVAKEYFARWSTATK